MKLLYKENVCEHHNKVHITRYVMLKDMKWISSLSASCKFYVYELKLYTWADF